MEYDKNIFFVREIQKNRCLYDFHTLEYSRRDITDKAWNDIAEKMSCSVQQCKERWKNLRSVYCRNRKNSVNKIGKRKSRPYYLKSHMKFLEPFLKLNKNSYNDAIYPIHIASDAASFIETIETKEEEEITESERDEEVEVDVKPQIKKKSTNETLDIETCYIENYPPKKQKQPIDSNPRRMYLLSLLPEINEMSEQKFRTFKRRILNMIDQINDESSED